jgi:hypothetical protein
MNKKIQIALIIAVAIVAGIVLFDSISTRVDKRPDNPYEYNIDEFKVVDESLISYREARQIEIETGEPKAFAWHNGNLYLLTESYLQVISPEGQELLKKNIQSNPGALTIAPDGTILVAYQNHLVAYSAEGEEIIRSQPLEEESQFTSVAVSDKTIFVADGGKKEVVVFDRQLKQTGSFKGESGVSALHGFILPSLHFHMAINNNDELWVVNPGMHRIQNYADNGRLRGDWGTPAFTVEGFSGCCNPCYFAFMPDGRFVTSEKGMVRVKIHKESGELESVVAAPDKFPNSEMAPAVAVDNKNNVWLLDFDKRMLRLFIPV